MSKPATPGPVVRVRPGLVLRFILGVIASVLLMAGAMTLVLATGSALVPGWRVTTVSSASMEPALQVGDAVAVAAHPVGQPMLGPPSIVMIERRGSVPLLHRVLGNDGMSYETKGDANPAADSDRVQPQQVIGAARLVVPGGGWIALWVQQGNILALAALAGTVAVLGWLARFGWLDRYDPWLEARRRSAHSARQPSAGGAGGASPAGAGSSMSLAILRGAAGLMSISLCALSSVEASASMFSARTTGSQQIDTARLQPPTDLRARCTTLPQVVASAAAGPSAPRRLMPADIRAGDNLLLSRTGVLQRDSTGNLSYPNTPSGWRRLGIVIGGADRFHAIYRRTATGGESGQYLPHVYPYADVLLVARGGTVVDESLAGWMYESGTSITAPSVDGQIGGLLLTFWAVERSNTLFSTPPGMSAIANTTFTSDVSMSAHQQQISRSGATGTRSTSMTDRTTGLPASDRNTGLSLFVRSSPYARLDWTPTTSTKATGYAIARDGQTVARLQDSGARSWLDPTQLASTPSTYEVTTTVGNWRSSPAKTTVAALSC